MNSWYSLEGANGDVALSSRIRIVRNIKKYPFPNRMNDEQISAVNELVKAAVFAPDSPIKDALDCIDMDSLNDTQATAMEERKLVTPEFIMNRRNKILLLTKDETVSIMVCSEDHIRIQVTESGLSFETVYEIAEGIDNVICSSLPIAFDEQLGFLTECPTNLGTGMKATVLLHLPALEQSGELQHIAESVSRIGLTLSGKMNNTGINGPSTYMLSNQVTLGITEASAISNLKSISQQIITRERATRERMDRISAEDSVYRALAVLKSARKLETDELDTMLSKIKLGISLGIIENMSEILPLELYFATRPNMLQLEYGSLTQKDCEYIRAEFIRKALT